MKAQVGGRFTKTEKFKVWFVIPGFWLFGRRFGPWYCEKRGSRKQVGWGGPNQLLVTGLNYMGGNGSWLTWGQVGNGSIPPVSTDTGLQSWVAGTNTIHNQIFGAQPSAPNFGWKRTVFRFGEGDAAGNLSECGVGWGSTGSTIICRHLIRNQVGDPVTITVDPDEWLDLTYEFRCYPPLTDVVANHDIGGLTYEVTTRAANVTSGTDWGAPLGNAMGEDLQFVSDWSAWDGLIGTIEQNPSGTSQAIDATGAVTNEVYQNNSLERVMQANCGPNGWNVVDGIRSISYKTTLGAYQSQYVNDPGGADGKLPKTVNETYQFNWTISWDEKV